MSALDESVCRCEREPAWCDVHRRWGRMMSSPPTRMELIEQVRGLTATVIAQADEIATLRAAYASDLAGLRAEVRLADDERATWRDLRDAAREMLAALEAPAPAWDADESDHDEHAARLTAAIDALRLRALLPAEAVVSCPACGVDITADSTTARTSCDRTRGASPHASVSATSCGATAGPCGHAETPTG